MDFAERNRNFKDEKGEGSIGKPTRWIFLNPVPNQTHYIAEAKHLLDIFKQAQSHGGAVDYATQIYKGTQYRFDTSGDIDNVYIKPYPITIAENRKEELETNYPVPDICAFSDVISWLDVYWGDDSSTSAFYVEQNFINPLTLIPSYVELDQNGKCSYSSSEGDLSSGKSAEIKELGAGVNLVYEDPEYETIDKHYWGNLQDWDFFPYWECWACGIHPTYRNRTDPANLYPPYSGDRADSPLIFSSNWGYSIPENDPQSASWKWFCNIVSADWIPVAYYYGCNCYNWETVRAEAWFKVIMTEKNTFRLMTLEHYEEWDDDDVGEILREFPIETDDTMGYRWMETFVAPTRSGKGGWATHDGALIDYIHSSVLPECHLYSWESVDVTGYVEEEEDIEDDNSNFGGYSYPRNPFLDDYLAEYYITNEKKEDIKVFESSWSYDYVYVRCGAYLHKDTPVYMYSVTSVLELVVIYGFIYNGAHHKLTFNAFLDVNENVCHWFDSAVYEGPDGNKTISFSDQFSGLRGYGFFRCSGYSLKEWKEYVL